MLSIKQRRKLYLKAAQLEDSENFGGASFLQEKVMFYGHVEDRYKALPELGLLTAILSDKEWREAQQLRVTGFLFAFHMCK